VADFTAVLDASVLYSAALRDLLLTLAAGDLYRPAWSELIHNEWMRNVIAKYGRGAAINAYVRATRRRMDAVFPDALVNGFEGLIASLNLPDPEDRHVLAATIQIGATAIVTYNLRHFPSPALAGFGIEVLHPDGFVDRRSTPLSMRSESYVRGFGHLL
jgi:predicted nucleic acid-binding protein